MGLTRYTLDSVRSCIWVSGRSNLHPINTETRGITGWFESSARDDGTLDLEHPVSGELELAVDRLTSGNQLYDHELRRRMDARRYPTIVGRVTSISASGPSSSLRHHGRHLVPRQDKDLRTRDADRSARRGCLADRRIRLRHPRVRHEPPSMLMVRVYPEINVRVELHGNRET